MSRGWLYSSRKVCSTGTYVTRMRRKHFTWSTFVERRDGAIRVMLHP